MNNTSTADYQDDKRETEWEAIPLLSLSQFIAEVTHHKIELGFDNEFGYVEMVSPKHPISAKLQKAFNEYNQAIGFILWAGNRYRARTNWDDIGPRNSTIVLDHMPHTMGHERHRKVGKKQKLLVPSRYKERFGAK